MHAGHRPEWTFELVPELCEPRSVLLRPVALRAVEVVSVCGEHTDDAVSESGDLPLHCKACSYELSHGFLLFVGHRNGREVSAPVELGQADRLSCGQPRDRASPRTELPR